jgi:hypothetical protein
VGWTRDRRSGNYAPLFIVRATDFDDLFHHVRQANLKRARAAYAGSKNYKDQKVAEADEIREHAPHLVKPAKPK